MSLIPFRSFGDLERFFGDDDFFSFASPAIDIKENTSTVTATAELPGIDPENVDVEVEDQMLTIAGSTEEKKGDEGKNYTRKEIRKGSFRRSVHLPARVESGKADAIYKDGLLKIVMQKVEEDSQPKKIEIKRED